MPWCPTTYKCLTTCRSREIAQGWLPLEVVLTLNTLTLDQPLLGGSSNTQLVLIIVYKVDFWEQLVDPEPLLRRNIQNHECVGYKFTKCLFVNYKMMPFQANMSSVVLFDTSQIAASSKHLWKQLQYDTQMCPRSYNWKCLCYLFPFPLSPSGDSYNIHTIWP